MTTTTAATPILPDARHQRSGFPASRAGAFAARDAARINTAWQAEASLNRLGLRPSADKTVQAAIIPAGGDWQCVAPEGAVTRMVVWRNTEVALINPRGDLDDVTEGHIAMAIRATPALDKALRTIAMLASDAANLDLIGKIARAAVDYIEQPAPRIVEEPDEALDDQPDLDDGGDDAAETQR